jgi:DNA-binding NtrC family response regulator
MADQNRILYCEDDATQAHSLTSLVKCSLGYDIEHLICAHKLKDVEDKDSVKLIISDGNMITSTWKDSIFYKGNFYRKSNFILYTGSWDAEQEALRLGLCSVSKGQRPDYILRTIEEMMK